MDKGADTIQRIVVIGAVILAIIIVLVIGYSLYTKAKRAEGELANKIALDNQTKKETADANISLTGESKNSPTFSYDGLIQKKSEEATTTDFEIVNETEPVEVPEEEVVPKEEAIPPEDPEIPEDTPPAPAEPADDDRPLTEEEIRAIRQLPIDDSPSGNLQTSLEEESGGQYKARY